MSASYLARIERKWSQKFVEYTEFIANHPNYVGMPGAFKEDGTVRWVVTANSELGKERMQWWERKRAELNIPVEKGCWAKVARSIHPTGKKPCQICGREMSLDYIYPNKRNGMSPGAMSDVPDRFDGYHTYNLCCRKVEDTGRHDDNLSRYGQDRRAYENWAEGDWKAADWLMQVYRKNGLSPDHIGPISLGFCHRPTFRVTTLKENIDKRNVMSYNDVKTLLTHEHNGDQVVSWHTKSIWDNTKNLVRNDADASKLSKILRVNLHSVLMMLAKINESGHGDFLVKNFLNPDYAYYSIEFQGFDPKTGEYEKMIKRRGQIKQYENNAKRYIRISLEALDDYVNKENRRVKSWASSNIEHLLEGVIDSLNKKDEDNAKRLINSILMEFTKIGIKEFQQL